MEIKGEKYNIAYDMENATIFCSGTLDFRGKEGYREMAALLEKAVNSESPRIILDIRELEFLNSSGITTLGGFIIKIRKKGASHLTIRGSKKYSWQARSVKGLQKLLPSMNQEFE